MSRILTVKNPNRQFMTLKEVAFSFRKSISTILSLAEEGQLILSVLYTAEEYSKLSPELKINPPLFWNLDRFSVMKIVNDGSVKLIPPGTYEGPVDGFGFPAKRIDKPSDMQPAYKDWKQLYPSNIQVEININRLRISINEFNRLSSESKIENKAKRGRRKSTSSYLAACYKLRHPEGSWKDCSGLSFSAWLEKQDEPLQIKDEGKVILVLVEYEDGKFMGANWPVDSPQGVLKSLSETSLVKALSTRTTLNIIEQNK